MKYKLLKQGVVVNTIMADKQCFVEKYCSDNGLTFEEIQEVTPDTVIPTPADLREEAYNTTPLIEWEGQMRTVTQAATKWYYYAAEGSAKADELQALIAEAKETIREQYPDEEGSA